MSKKVNYKKIVKDLNEELALKYNSLEFRNDLGDYEMEENHHYFTLEKDTYGHNVIYFLSMIIYLEEISLASKITEEEIIIETKYFFNKYMDSLAKLKF
jgi:hypothetical protein